MLRQEHQGPIWPCGVVAGGEVLLSVMKTQVLVVDLQTREQKAATSRETASLCQHRGTLGIHSSSGRELGVGRPPASCTCSSDFPSTALAMLANPSGAL